MMWSMRLLSSSSFCSFSWTESVKRIIAADFAGLTSAVDLSVATLDLGWCLSVYFLGFPSLLLFLL